MATIITKNSSTASSIPTAVQLVQGELAVNVTDKRLFTENSAGAVVELGTNPSSITTGTLTATGNVGIGTSSPTAKLAVDTTNSAEGIRVTVGQGSYSGYVALFGVSGSSNGYYIQKDAVNNIKHVWDGTGGAERMRIDSGGNVGIGTSAPGAKLDVTVAGANLAQQLVGTSGVYSRIGTASSSFYTIHNGTTDTFLYTAEASALRLGTNSTERMRIDSSGNLLVGQTSAGAANLIGTSIENSGLNNARITVNHSNAGSSNGSSYMQFAYAGTVTGTISQSSTSTVAYNTSSDYRLKNTIAPMTGALAKVALLKPVTYKWKVDGSDGQGFIAHELAEVEPGCVTGEKDATETRTVETAPAIPAEFDEDGVETSPAVPAVTEEQVVPKYQGIDTSFLVATLVAAIQEQQAMLVSLKATVDAQAVKIAALEAK
jgi:hypothetical protein